MIGVFFVKLHYISQLTAELALGCNQSCSDSFQRFLELILREDNISVASCLFTDYPNEILLGYAETAI